MAAPLENPFFPSRLRAFVSFVLGEDARHSTVGPHIGQPRAQRRTEIRADEETDVLIEDESDVRPPPLFKVILHNDDYTTMDFVIYVLRAIFRRTESDALRIMLQVHHDGVGVAGVYPFEIAEAKAAKAVSLARANEYPLLCTLEPE